MGQQQLLLVILVTIVVGIATVIAINTFQQAHESAELDSVRQDILMAHAYSKIYYMKSNLMGGGGESFINISLDHISLPIENEYAYYNITETSAEYFTLSYTPRFNNQTYSVTIGFDEIIWNGEKEE